MRQGFYTLGAGFVRVNRLPVNLHHLLRNLHHRSWQNRAPVGGHPLPFHRSPAVSSGPTGRVLAPTGRNLGQLVQHWSGCVALRLPVFTEAEHFEDEYPCLAETIDAPGTPTDGKFTNACDGIAAPGDR